MATPAQPYFAPAYYSPYYFPSLAADGVTPAPAPRFRDRDAYNAIVAALTATGAFADVAFGTTFGNWAAGVDRTPAAVVTPDSWAEVDDADPRQLVRRVAYSITIVARDEDPMTRFDALDRLTAEAQNALDGLDLGGTCLPPLTLIRRGRFDLTSRPPDQVVNLLGEFTYLIPSLTGHDSSY